MYKILLSSTKQPIYLHVLISAFYSPCNHSSPLLDPTERTESVFPTFIHRILRSLDSLVLTVSNHLSHVTWNLPSKAHTLNPIFEHFSWEIVSRRNKFVEIDMEMFEFMFSSPFKISAAVVNLIYISSLFTYFCMSILTLLTICSTPSAQLISLALSHQSEF